MSDLKPHRQTPARVLDSSGKPVLAPVSWRERWSSVSRATRIVAVSVAAGIAAIASVLANLNTIRAFISGSPSVPPIAIVLTNSSEVSITVSARGDFVLWSPGISGGHTIGKYEFRGEHGVEFDSGTVTVGPSKKKRVLAHLMNKAHYGQVLQQGGGDISFMVRLAHGGHRSTDGLPFTLNAISKYHDSADVGSEIHFADAVNFERKSGDFETSSDLWEGSWHHTEAIIGGRFSGLMELKANDTTVTGWCVNPQGGISEIEGELSSDASELTGKWHNRVSDKKGSFVLRLVAPNQFRGNYALEGKPIEERVNEWTGIKKTGAHE